MSENEKSRPAPLARSERRFILTGTLVVAAIVLAAGVVYYRAERDELRRQSFRELNSIADLKVNQVVNWHRERLGDARMTLQTPLFTRSAAEFLADPASAERRAVLEQWFEAMRRNYHYREVALFDRRGQPRLKVPAATETESAILRAILDRMPEAGDIVVSDLHRGAGEDIHMDLLIPLREGGLPAREPGAAAAAPPGRYIGSLLLRIDPHEYLYPRIQSWPTPSATAETLLVRREGNEVVYLNELRHRQGTALKLRLPAGDPSLPAARGVRGESGVVEGGDYRGIPVLAAVRPVPDTPWVLVAKVDQAEAFAPIMEKTWSTGLIVGLLLLGVALAAGHVWRQRSAVLLGRELTHLQEIARLTRLYAALSEINQVIVRAATREELFQGVCRALVEHAGFRMAWVGEHDPSAAVVRSVAAHGDDDGFLREIQIRTDGPPEAAGPIGVCLHEGRTYVCNDILLDPLTLPRREAATRRGLRASVALPVRRGTEVEAVLTVYAIRPGIFADKEVSLLEEAASDLGFGLEHLATDAALRSSEHLFRSVWEHSQDAMRLTDGEGKVVMVNRAYCEFVGKSRQEVEGRSLADVYAPDEREKVRQGFLQRYAQRDFPPFAERNQRLWNGREVWLSAATALLDAGDPASKVLDVFRDITERKRADEALRASEEVNRVTFEQAAVGITHVGLDGRYLRVNEKFCAIVGYSREELQQLTFQDITQAEDLEADLEQVRRLLAGEYPSYAMEKRYRRKDGSAVWTHLTVSLLRLPSGGPRHFVSIVEDIEARKRAEAALRESEQRYRTTLDSMLEGCQMIGFDWRYLYVNETAARHGRQARLALVGQRMMDAYPGIEGTPLFAAIQQCLEDRIPHQMENQFVFPDGSNGWFELSIQPNPEGAFILSIDISERKRAEEVQAFLAQTGSGMAAESFFNTLARFLAGNLGMDFVCIDRLEGDGLTARTLAVWCDGHFEDNVAYALKDTPCGDVVGKTVCCFPASVCQIFPRDQVLKDLRAESYVGVTLFGHTGRPIGLIAVIGRSPLESRPLAEATLKSVAGRAAGELERLDAEDALRKAKENFSKAFISSPTAISINIMGDGRYLEVNEAWERLSGFRREEALGKTPRELQLWADEAEWHQARHLIESAGRVREMECRFRRKSGDVMNGLLSTETIDFAGETCILSNTVDITELKRAEGKITAQLDELHRWHNAMLGREARMRELKLEINRLLAAAGQPPRFASVTEEGSAP